MMRQMLAAGIVLALATAAHAEGPLSIGDPAPKLKVKEFVKGEPVKALEKDNIYVVEFWATWCGPCKESIPHLTKLQKEFKDIVVIGVSVSEQDFDKVKPFVKEMGDKMDYRVAIDSVPAGKDAEDGAMNKTWMNAAEQEGIPTAFIVGKDGLIAWIGHPGEMDKPLGEIVAGKYDVKAAAVAYKAEKARAEKIRTIAEKLEKVDDAKEMLTIVDEAIRGDAVLERWFGPNKFNALYHIDTDKAADYGRRLIDGPIKSDPSQLTEVAWYVLSSWQAEKNLVQLAVDAADKAVKLTDGKDPTVLDTLAYGYFRNGDTAKAIETEERALKLAPDKKHLKERLARFQKAQEKSDK
jgi:thiol-disulfide isomerase/thioredoxin